MTSLTSDGIPSAYNPADVEQRVYQNWLDKGYFAANIDQSGDPFTIIMPPPNVTGELHLGHALEKAIEDALVRWHRMLGDPTLWLPGTDHAGIATQWAVERQLADEGRDRHQLGREEFVDLVWEHVGKYGGIIHEQSRRLGISADSSRHKFTLDPGPSKAVRTTFVNLYNKGLIYRHERIINWCPRCATALSDLEVDFQEQDGTLYYIRYPLEPTSPSESPLERGRVEAQGEDFITVATTRPETMLGDTGVAVNPEDSRYQHLLGRRAILPIMGRSIPVVADTAISREFGTGALKVTPGHNVIDFEIGQRHQLEIVNVIGLDGKMTGAAGKYSGHERFQTRREVISELQALGLLDEEEDYRHSVGHCQRCDSVVEPLISLQWFVNLGSYDQPDSIAGRAHAAVARDEIRIVPERFVRVYLNWLENIRDWCISRQLWWGHRIPVWYCGDCSHLTVSIEDATGCEACQSSKLHQDPDVLDTWFSSGLWPHSTLGWPEDTEDLRYFYPTSVLETGYDILFFWVARMIMLGIENTGQVPFRTVFIHGLVRDSTGAKMSKTRGNTMDPLDLLQRYGTDALRFALTTGTAPGNDLRFTEGRLESARNFANKVWNAARFVLHSLEGRSGLAGWYELATPEHREDRWILSRLDRLIAEVNQSLENFELGDAQQKLYDFIWSDFCDWYIEMAKIRLRSGSGPSPLPTLVHVLERTLRMLHPFMPFITEEIWQNLMARLPREGSLHESIMVSPYPQVEGNRRDDQAERDIQFIIGTIKGFRNTRNSLRIPSDRMVEAILEGAGVTETTSDGVVTEHKPSVANVTENERLVADWGPLIRTLARVEPRAGSASELTSLRKDGISVLVGRALWWLDPKSLVDRSTEIEKLQAELADCLRNLERVSKLVSNPDFRAKAKANVVENEEERLRSLEERKQRLDDLLEQLVR